MYMNLTLDQWLHLIEAVSAVVITIVAIKTFRRNTKGDRSNSDIV